MPDHIVTPLNESVLTVMKGTATGEKPIAVLRQRIKEEVDKLLGYGQEKIIVHLVQPPADFDPDAVALDITIAASDNAKHRKQAEKWLDDLEAVVRDLKVFQTLLKMGGVSIFLPVGAGHYRPIKK